MKRVTTALVAILVVAIAGVPRAQGFRHGLFDQATNRFTGDVSIEGNLTVAGTTTATSPVFTTPTLGAALATSLEFEGSTADAFETILSVTDPTADATWSIPALTAGSYVFAQTVSPSFTTPALGAATATSLNIATSTTVSKFYWVKATDGGGDENVQASIPGVVATDTVIATVNASSNAAYVVKATPGTDVVDLVLSANPGASTEIAIVVIR